MKSVVFKYLKARNFMSIGDMVIDFTQYNGITFVTGKNLDDNTENGVGKTTIGHALWFVLSGEAPDKVKLEHLPNRESGSKSFETECEFTIDQDVHRIKRTNKKVEYWVNGVERTKTNSSVNEDILNAFGVDKLSLYQTMFVSVDGDVSFFEKKAAEKVKYIESVLNLKIFEKLFEQTKKTYNSLKGRRDVLEMSVTMLMRDVQKNEHEFGLFEYNQTQKYEKLQKTILGLRSELAALVVPVFQKIPDFEGKKMRLENVIRTKEQRIAVLENTIIKDRRELSKLKGLLNCPTCGKVFDDAHTKESQIQVIDTSINTSQEELDLLLAELKKHKENLLKSREYEKKVREEELVTQQRQNLEKQIVSWETQSANILLETNPFKEIADGKKLELLEKESELAVVRKDLKTYEVLKFVYSPDGVKNTIIKQIISLFNSILKNYLIQLNSPFKVTFDEFFDETIVHRGKSIAYGTLSRGEKARVMLSIVFAFRKLRRLQTWFNVDVTFYDEIFDLGLCKSGMKKCMEILATLDKSFVITHRSENIDLEGHGRLELIKKNSVTSLKK